MLDPGPSLFFLHEFLGIGILLISVVGLYVSWKHISFLKPTREIIGIRLRHIFIADFFIYVSSCIIGLFSLMNIHGPAAWMGIVLVPIAITLQLIASYRMYKYYTGNGNGITLKKHR